MTKDRRQKLSPEEKATVLHRWLNPFDDTSQRQLAREFGVSHRTIQLIIDEDKRKADAKRDRSGYYDKDKNTTAVRRYRARKGMYKKYRIYLTTKRGGSFTMAAVDTINGLANEVIAWLENTSQGRSIYDDQVQDVILYELDPDTGSYKFSEKLPATGRVDIVRKARELGAR